MLVSIQISTGFVIEMQSHATAGTLVNNAVNSGYLLEDVLEIETNNYQVGYVWNGSAFVESPTEKAKSVRAERDTKLAETDWRFRSDMTPSQEWKDYCQVLRDVPTQAGFPWTITWPVEPQ